MSFLKPKPQHAPGTQFRYRDGTVSGNALMGREHGGVMEVIPPPDPLDVMRQEAEKKAQRAAEAQRLRGDKGRASTILAGAGRGVDDEEEDAPGRMLLGAGY